MDASTLIFFVLATLLVISSLMVVFLHHVVHSALALVSALLIIAIFFVTLHAPMVGVLQVMVYAGAIMVLFLFVIMLLNPSVPEQPPGVWWGLATLLAVLLGGMMLFLEEPAGELADVSAAARERTGSRPRARSSCVGSTSSSGATPSPSSPLPSDIVMSASVMLTAKGTKVK